MPGETSDTGVQSPGWVTPGMENMRSQPGKEDATEKAPEQGDRVGGVGAGMGEGRGASTGGGQAAGSTRHMVGGMEQEVGGTRPMAGGGTGQEVGGPGRWGGGTGQTPSQMGKEQDKCSAVPPFFPRCRVLTPASTAGGVTPAQGPPCQGMSDPEPSGLVSWEGWRVLILEQCADLASHPLRARGGGTSRGRRVRGWGRGCWFWDTRHSPRGDFRLPRTCSIYFRERRAD